MVHQHRGKLSPACGRCRSRRLKCDQKRPSCSQCIRARTECSGYRDLTAGRFFDQTEEVKRKISPSSLSSSSSSPPSQKQKLSQPGALVRQQISAPLADHGTAFMMSRYLTRDGLRGPMETFLPNILNTPSGRAVTASIKAVGLSALSNIHNSPKLMLTARQEYITALAETNAALSNPMQSTSDSTLAAVAFLGIYEIMTCNGPPLMERYLNHLEGSAKLIQLRGSDQLKEFVGLGLFTQFRMTIVLGNFWLKKPTPSWLTALSHEAHSYREGTGWIEDELFLLISQVGDLCARMRDGAFIDSAKIVKKALKLDSDLNAWAISVKPSGDYTIVDVPASMKEGKSAYSPLRHIYGSQYHIYPDTVVSCWWNDYRFARLLLLELVCWLGDHLARKDEAAGAWSEHRQTIAQSTALSTQLCEEICASVPYYLGATETSPNENLSSPRTGSVIRLIWSLFIAADCTGTTPEMTEWIADSLFKIGHAVGIQQALVMSDILRSGRHLMWLPELG
ncbi:hypothetical protein BDW59DRAFT_146587 [Aspergillus cavernicola]|uniref:Zn(2)-C6 fungal-type domain-containing protein n=1 Tax=Aspergillus cavernicola TaxID=176166 RepID=A0ABR4IBS6_9EURO